MPSKSSSSLPGICVFCGSHEGRDPIYRDVTRRFGHLLVANGFRLVFGGGQPGLMGVLAEAVAEREGEILGFLPNFLRHLEPPVRDASTIEITETLYERKTKMFAAADGFAVLPGGLGTLDEFFEALTGAQLSQHAKPIVVINTKDYFGPLIALIDHMASEGFVRPENKKLIEIVSSPEEAFTIFAGLRPTA